MRTSTTCAQEKCLGHVSEWEDVGPRRFIPKPGWFSTMTYLQILRCCGKRRERVLEVQDQRCRQCGKTRSRVTQIGARCPCCGDVIYTT